MSKIHVNWIRRFPKEWHSQTEITVCEVELRAPDRVNIPYLVHDTRLYQIDIKMTYN